MSADVSLKSARVVGPEQGAIRKMEWGEAAATYSLIVTTKLNDVDPRAWLANVLARIEEDRLHRQESASKPFGRSGNSGRYCGVVCLSPSHY